ncbi:hypothetical protein BDY19DRAFT_996383 [Irpex rosettiformis]|uniref:Uncharacterized protein n=1 Tax=Irpex rosettiformis TaxID=378272 RepID=A0ACB8TV86_9APHY|nr:hypothetical protein BDY19DRAFT_996383 [Irpex rosettiformis]
MKDTPQTIASISDYFDNDPEFIKALVNIVIPEDTTDNSSVRVNIASKGPEESEDRNDDDIVPPPSTQPPHKRRRSSSSEEGDRVARTLNDSVTDSIDHAQSKTPYLLSDTYGSSPFGNFSEHIRRKRQKLQIQNPEIDTHTNGLSPQLGNIFSGLRIYINGWTHPSAQELRQLIVNHGGIFHAYLDNKSLVTHIVTCSLTPVEIQEFKHMKMATPDWLVKSAEAGVLLPWSNFKYEPNSPLLMPAKGPAYKAEQHISTGGDFVEGSSRQSNSPDPNITTTPPSRQQKHVPGPSTPPPPADLQTKPATTTLTRILSSGGPSTLKDAAFIPEYAPDESNAAAQRAMADPAWRAAHTSVAPDFIEGFYRNSRLHHLSMWKAELRNLVSEAQELAESGNHTVNRPPLSVDEGNSAVMNVVLDNMDGKTWTESGVDEDVSLKGAHLVKGKGKEKASDNGERVIMHCDFDSFFVSAGLVDRPHLRGKPVVVCHSQGAQGGRSSTSEIASASYEARSFGIKGGMSLQQARALCPDIITIPYEFQRYKQLSLQFYTILMAHADDLQAVSVDEVLIDVTSSVRRIKAGISLVQDKEGSSAAPDHRDPAEDFAEAIRTQVRSATGCEVSIGIAHNIMLARLASRKAKPAGSYHLLQEDVSSFIENLDIDDLHGFGYAAYQKAQGKLGTTSLRELVQKSRAVLCDALGKGTGETLYKALRGIDDRKLESDKPRRSVSCDINYGIRFENNEQAETFIYQLSEEVARRLQSISMGGRSLTLKIMKRDPSAPVEAPKFMGHGLCESFTKQIAVIAPRSRATSNPKIIGDHAWKLLNSMNFNPKELRGIGIQMQKLEKADLSSGSGYQEQSVLDFKPVSSPRKERPEKVEQAEMVDESTGTEDPTAPPQTVPETTYDLPSFSRVDRSVFEALPDDLRAELETEYRSRSVTPAVAEEDVKGKNRARSTSVFSDTSPRKEKMGVKGTDRLNVKHITKQLAPKSRAGLSAKKNTLFHKRPAMIPSDVGNSVKLKVSEEDLRKMEMDPEVFLSLPPDVQREQLALARHTKNPGKGAISYATQRKVLKPAKR